MRNPISWNNVEQRVGSQYENAPPLPLAEAATPKAPKDEMEDFLDELLA